jgi:hypothetical protein
MGLYFYNGKLLFVSGSIAAHEDCCCPDVVCAYCQSGYASAVVNLAVAGVSNGTYCAGCAAAFNDSHPLPTSGACQWLKQSYSPLSCGPLGYKYPRLQFGVGYDAGLGGYIAGAVVGLVDDPSDIGYSSYAEFRKVYGETAPDCLAFANEGLPRIATSGNASCLWTASSVSVSAV